jgi:hypothetical protein
MDPALAAGEEDIYWNDMLVLAMPWKREHERHPDHLPYYLGDSLLSTRTNDRGEYELIGMEPGLYKLRFSPYKGYDATDRESTLGAWPQPLFLELNEPGLVDAGTWIAKRARPCDVVGSVKLPDGGSVSGVVLEVTYPKDIGADRSFSKMVPLKSDGTFSCFVLTSTDATPATAKLKRLGAPDWEVTEEFTVTPYEIVALELELSN